MPSKADYKQIIEDKLSTESDKKNQGKTDGVFSTIQESGSGPDVSTKDKYDYQLNKSFPHRN